MGLSEGGGGRWIVGAEDPEAGMAPFEFKHPPGRVFELSVGAHYHVPALTRRG